MQCAVSCLGTARVRVQGHLTRAPPRTHARLCSAAVLQAASGIGRHNSGYIRAMKDGGNCLQWIHNIVHKHSLDHCNIINLNFNRSDVSFSILKDMRRTNTFLLECWRPGQLIGSEAPLKCSQRYSRLIIIRFLYKLIIAGLGGPTVLQRVKFQNTCSCSCEAEQ